MVKEEEENCVSCSVYLSGIEGMRPGLGLGREGNWRERFGVVVVVVVGA